VAFSHTRHRGQGFDSGPDENQYALERLMLDALARKAEADEVPSGPTQEIDDKARTIIRSLGSGLLLESEFLLSAAEDERARQNKDALAVEWNEGFESRQGEINALQERYRALEFENKTLRKLFTQPALTPSQEASQGSVQQAPARPLEERMGVLLGL